MSETDLRLPLSIDLINLIKRNKMGKVISKECIENEQEYSEIIEIDFNIIELPQFPINDVKEVERIRIKITDGSLPIVYCRDDFPIVPHLNVYNSNVKSLCLFDVPYEELKYSINAKMLLDRISYWFTKIARGELHQPDQLLEPFFPYVNDIIILKETFKITSKINLIRLKELEYDFGSLLIEQDLNNNSIGELYIVIPIRIRKIYSDNIIRKQVKNLNDLSEAFEDENILKEIENYIQEIWKLRQNNFIYKTFFNQSLKLLKKSKILLMVIVGLARESGGDIESCTIKAFSIDSGYKELYRNFGYKIEKNKLVKTNPVGNFEDLELRQLEVINQLNNKLAQRLNNLENTDCSKNFFQIGVGTLGSQIANNCIRAGYGKWTFLDSDILLPHNLARHTLTAQHIGLNKAESMYKYAIDIIEYDDIVKGFRKYNIFNKDAKSEIINRIRQSDLVIDTSASVAVERYLCHELVENTRCVSFFMNPKGTSLVMLLEDKKRNITLDLLEMQYYKLLINNVKFESHLEVEDYVIYSTNCRSKSAKLSQDNVSLFSAIASKAIKQFIDDPKARVIIWSLDCLSVDMTSIESDLFESYYVNGWKIKLLDSVKKDLFENRKNKLPNETGGVLLGSFDYYNKICYIIENISSPDDSIESPNSYIRGSKGLLQKITKIQKITVDNMVYVGEWHSHPSNDTSPSEDDKILLNSIAKYNAKQCLPGIMAIVGENHISFYLQDDFS